MYLIHSVAFRALVKCFFVFSVCAMLLAGQAFGQAVNLAASQSGSSIISLFFPNDVGSNLSLVFGSYSASIALNDGDLPGSGSGTVNNTPEPPSSILLGTVLLLGSALIFFRHNLPHKQ